MKVLGPPKRAAARVAQMPALVAPMLASLSQRLPVNGEEWAFEYKWDGVRAIARWDGRARQRQTPPSYRLRAHSS